MKFTRLDGATSFDSKDNVATACRALKAGKQSDLGRKKEARPVVLQQDIPIGHKFALADIPGGEMVYKYGEIIGRAVTPIRAGEHVHIHNVESLRGRGDLGWRKEG